MANIAAPANATSVSFSPPVVDNESHDLHRETGKGIIFVIEPKDGLPEGEFPLSLPSEGLPQPEIMTAREMLAVGNPFVRLPELSR